MPIKADLQLVPCTHIKTGNAYFYVKEQALECTNGREDKPYTVYFNALGQMFVRETSEFQKKFHCAY